MNKYLLLVLLFCHQIMLAQSIISGAVKDNNGTALIGANIIVQPLNQTKILAYAITQKDGKYKIKVPQITDSLVVSASYFGYATKKIKIANQTQSLNFILKVAEQHLKEVVIKSQPVNVRGDTINYSVSSLKTKEDRVLADVIKRIPGIDIKPNGTIYYEGKAINKFYIENLDMLNGRYNLASNNMPVDQVASVQVYENHQPIKLLDSLVYSDRAALNIRLKKNFSYALPYEIASGYKPVLWQLKFTPMFFRKNSQMLDVFQTNNTGHRLANEIQDLTAEHNLRISGGQKLISISNIAPPPFDENKWLDNTSFLASVNYLIRLSKTANLKTNISYVPEKEKAIAQTEETVFLNHQNIQINDFYEDDKLNREADINLVYEQNSKKIYFKNTAHLNYKNDLQTSDITSKKLHQKLSNPNITFNNKFSWLFPLGKQIFNLNGRVFYKNNQAHYQVTPGQFSQIFNNGQTFNSLTQQLSQKQLGYELNTGFTKKYHHWTLQDFIVVQQTFHRLNSDLTPSQHTTYSYEDYKNKIDVNDLTLTNQINISYTNEAWHFNMEIPVAYKNLTISDKIDRTQNDLKGIFTDFNIYAGYQINKWHISLNYQYDNDFEDMSQKYDHFILKSYNQLEKKASVINKTLSNDYRLILKYKDILNGFNAKLIFSNNDIQNSLLEHYRYAPDGSFQMEALPVKTQSNTKRALVNFGKYFFKSKISTKLQSLFEWRQNPVYLNQNITKRQYKTWLLTASINVPIFEKLALYFDIKQNKYLFENEANNFTQYDFKNDIYLYPFKSHQINLSTHYFLYQDNKKGDLFMNLSYRFKPSKKHWTLYARWLNITGLKTYTTYFNNAVYTYKSTFYLRPMSFLIGFKSAF